VLAVDGRKPATPSQLLRILRSYERNESMKLDVLRDHKRETITGKLGDKGER
jgi:S1-C subfamily serine protease